jgi:hypothetical protein
MEYKYDVTLSFAGEDREYVDKVAAVLKDAGIKVFYDKFEEVDLWGKDLGVHFDFVYRKSAQYCVPFISKHYKEKVWTRHEIRTAIARAIESNDEYILPVRFDDTEIEGVRPTLGFIDLRKYQPEEFAKLIIAKVKKEQSVAVARAEQPKEAANIYLGHMALISEYKGYYGVAFSVIITNLQKEFRYFNEPSFKLSNAFEDKADSFYLLDKLESAIFPAKLEHGQICKVTYNLKPSMAKLWESLPTDTTVIAVVTSTIGEKFFSNPINVKDVLKAFKEIKKQ